MLHFEVRNPSVGTEPDRQARGEPAERLDRNALEAIRLSVAEKLRCDYTQTLADHGVLASVGTVGDAYDNAMAESFVDSFKTELIADRVWRSRSQLELAVVEYVAWFNNERLHESLGDISPAEFEDLYVQPGGREISPFMKIGSN